MSSFDVDDFNHALRNPLMVILGRAYLMQRALTQKAKLTEMEIGGLLRDLEAIDSAIADLIAVLDDLDLLPGDGPDEAPQRPSC
jgi:signal transduction histidine kinase